MRLAFAPVLLVAWVGCRAQVIEETTSSGATSHSTGTQTSSSASTSAATTTASGATTSATSTASASTGTSMMPGACVASNFLSHDSFDVVASALDACFQQGAQCSIHTATSISLPNLAEGVGDVDFAYATAADGTHTLVGHGNPDVASAPPGIVLEASGIPANVGLDEALSVLYGSSTDFNCVWQ